MSQGSQSFSFHRRYHSYTGGHQKVRDYLGHTLAYRKSRVDLWLDNQSDLHPELFEQIPGVNYRSDYRPNLSDVVFLAGMDWKDYLPRMDEKRPKINLIQHIRHSDPSHPLFEFLQHRAIRICVSEAVRQAILPHANGPCLTIRMGYAMPQVSMDKKFDLYVLANKQPELGNRLAQWAASQGYRYCIHDHYVPREDVHISMAKSRVTLVLPNKTEGFYLPGIEAMKLSDWAVVPDCIANREYCLKGRNVSLCDYEESAIQSAVDKAFASLKQWGHPVTKWRGKQLVNSYSLAAERRAYHKILGSLHTLWNNT